MLFRSYVADVKKELFPRMDDPRYASVSKDEDGTLVMTVYGPSWELCAVEDFALVLLHEYTHVVIWDRLEASIPNLGCRSAVHELFANQSELDQVQIQGTLTMRRGTYFAYVNYYHQAQSYCLPGVIDLFPKPEIE